MMTESSYAGGSDEDRSETGEQERVRWEASFASVPALAPDSNRIKGAYTVHTRQTQSPIYSRAFVEHVLAAYLADPAAALLVTPVVGLWKSAGFAPTVESVKADFTAAEADFDDYVKVALGGVGPVSIGGLGRAVQGVPSWLMITDPMVSGNTIRGYWVEDANRVVMYEQFPDDQFVSMDSLGASLIIEVLLPMLYNQPVG